MMICSAYFDAMSSRLDVAKRLERLERKLAVASEVGVSLSTMLC